MNKAITTTLLALATISQTSQADEGQWQPHQIAQLQSELTRVGIELPAKQVADLNQYPMNAVVGLGYCSASFVSPQGLVVTNHHCGYGAIQHNTTVENNLANNGFLAKSLTEELSAGPQERVYITEAVTDVTDQVTGQLGDLLTGKKRFDAIQNNRKKLIKACETDANYRCSVRSFHHGMEYFLLKQLMIKDVRLVYAPPEAVGNFGADIDNYEYPRHTGDFTFLRAYVDKAGKPAPFSPDNVPYQPKSFLKINGAGVQQGDGVILAGYPGKTSRYKLASEIAFAAQWEYPARIKMYNSRLDTIAAATKGRPDAQVKYSSTVKSINNGMKKRMGLLDGFKVTDIHRIKSEHEKTLLDWIKKDSSRKEYADAHQQLSKLLEQSQQMNKSLFYLDIAQSAKLIATANKLYHFAKENEKPDAQRKIGYQQRDIAMYKAQLKRQEKRFDSQVDQQLWVAYLHTYLQQPSHLRQAEFDQALGIKSSTSLAELNEITGRFYQKSQLSDEKTRLNWLNQPVSAFVASDDPFIALAVKLYDSNLKNDHDYEEMRGLLGQARPSYMKAVIAYNQSLGKPIYPDANGTMRITYGTVDGYPAADGVYKTPFTSMKGMMAKNTDVYPFNVPEKIKQTYNNKRFGPYRQSSLDKPVQSNSQRKRHIGPVHQAFNDIPVNFLSSADTTGGNSGSAVMNGKGELVGLNFDSTYESITKDWYFNAAITRAIHVDIRYVLWILSEVEQADNLLKEMTIKGI